MSVYHKSGLRILDTTHMGALDIYWFKAELNADLRVECHNECAAHGNQFATLEGRIHCAFVLRETLTYTAQACTAHVRTNTQLNYLQRVHQVKPNQDDDQRYTSSERR